jgi:putative Holliday junction resolvase
LLGIDYGLKRVGLAITDPLQIIATALETVPVKSLIPYLEAYCADQEVEAFVVGMPKDLTGQPTDSTRAVRKFVETLKSKFPAYPVHLHDERYTSRMALDAMIASGSTKKDRRKKENIDKLSAVIILQSYMEAQSYKK